jgi:thymidylate kinase
MKKGPYRKAGLALLALAACFYLCKPAAAQSTPAQDSRPVQDRDANRAELANFNRFLDSHREISEQLRKNPSLVDNREFVKNHPALQTYLQDHPGVREAIKQDPNGFMHAEDRLDHREDNRDRNINREELANFDRFLDSHREISEQLRKDPSLVDNGEFVKNHPALQTYLQDHPAVREQIKENPNAFMHAEDRLDRREDNRDANHAELANFDRFLDSHREISEQLRKDPSLVDNREFVKNHPELQTYLQDHPGVREAIKQDPNAFMQEEARYERREDGMDPNRDGRHTDADHDIAHRHFGEFLGGHADVAEQLSRNPSLVKDQNFMDGHPELKAYLNSNPDVRENLMSDPDGFVKASQQFSTTNGQSVKPPAAKPKPNQ